MVTTPSTREPEHDVELRGVWTGASTTTNFATIYPDETIVPYQDALLGAHGPAVKPQPKSGLAAAVWGDRMGLGIVSFEDLNVRLRARLRFTTTMSLPFTTEDDPRRVGATCNNWILSPDGRSVILKYTYMGAAGVGKLYRW